MAAAPFARRLRRVAAAILLIGLTVAGAVGSNAERADEPVEFGEGSIAAAREQQQLERLGGKSAVLMLRFQQWFESLFHGERLAWTIGALSLIVAAFCWHLAALADEEDQ